MDKSQITKHDSGYTINYASPLSGLMTLIVFLEENTRNRFNIEIPSIHNLFFSLNNYNERTDKNEEVIVPAASENKTENAEVHYIHEYRPKYYKLSWNQFSHQLKALLNKNYLVFKRKMLIIILQMVIPSFIFVLGYLVVKAAFPTAQKKYGRTNGRILLSTNQFNKPLINTPYFERTRIPILNANEETIFLSADVNPR